MTSFGVPKSIEIVLIDRPEEAASGAAEMALGPLPVITHGGRAFVTHPELIEEGPGMFLGQTLHEGSKNLTICYAT